MLLKIIPLILMIFLLNGCDSHGAFSSEQSATLYISPNVIAIPIGTEQKYEAYLKYTDGRKIDVSADPRLSWSAKDAQIISIDKEKGVAKGLSIGNTVITAFGTFDGQELKAKVVSEVTDAVITSLNVTPTLKPLPVGLSKQFDAYAYFSDGTVVDVTKESSTTWESSNSTYATVINGLTTGHAEGSVEISASINFKGTTLTDSVELNITTPSFTSLSIYPTSKTIPVGIEKNLQAIATFSNGLSVDITNDPAVIWDVDDHSIAKIDKGKVTGRSAGNTNVEASVTFDNVTYNTVINVEVTNAIVTSLTVSPSLVKIPKGLTQQFTAIANLSDGRTIDVTHNPSLNWSSRNDSIATANNGLVTGNERGVTTITASGVINNALFSDTAELEVTNAIVTSLEVTPKTQQVPEGMSLQLDVTLYLSDGTRISNMNNAPQISWQSDDNSIANVSNKIGLKGLASGIAAGSSKIKASGYFNNKLFSNEISLEIIDAVITDLEVIPSTKVLIPIGLEQQFQAEAIFSNGLRLDITNESALTWSSADSTLASIENNTATSGLVVGKAIGTTTITASGTANGEHFSQDVEVEVTPAIVTSIDVSPSSIQIPLGSQQNFTATAILSDSSTNDVTYNINTSWFSDDTNIATVVQGLLSTSEIGTANIHALYEGIRSNTAATEIIHNTTQSQVFGQARPTDDKLNYLLGNSRLITFKCGWIVDAMGTPELGMTGGAGGDYYQVSGDDIDRVQVYWGDWKHNGGGVTISQINLFYTNGNSFTCGRNYDVTKVKSGVWNVPSGEKFNGFIISAGSYTHELQVASITK
jgi:hypothetical protein